MADPIFLVGRFRSGTSLIWSWFDQDPGCVAYYEPLHDNLRTQIATTRPTASHRGISDYWSAYRSILPDMDEYYRTEFGVDRLLLEASDHYDVLRDYISMLLRAAGSNRPVLKFTRADFRIGWLQREFPEAIVIYVQRDNRNVWLSSRAHLNAGDVDDPNHPDAFEQLQWSAALGTDFPFLWLPKIDSFTRHYFLWSLSQTIGTRSADVTLDFDAVVDDPSQSLDLLVERGLLSADLIDTARRNVDRKQRADWRQSRSETWFSEREQSALSLLQDLGLAEHFGQKPLREIRSDFASEWGRLPPIPTAEIASRLLHYASDRRSEVTRLLGELTKEKGRD